MMYSKPANPNEDIVVSVKHTGTHSLAHHLGLNHYLHFGPDDDSISEMKGIIHIPIRRLADVVNTWSYKYGDKGPNAPGSELLCFDALIRFSRAYRARCRFYCTEDLPVRLNRTTNCATRTDIFIERLSRLADWLLFPGNAEFFAEVRNGYSR